MGIIHFRLWIRHLIKRQLFEKFSKTIWKAKCDFKFHLFNWPPVDSFYERFSSLANSCFDAVTVEYGWFLWIRWNRWHSHNEVVWRFLWAHPDSARAQWIEPNAIASAAKLSLLVYQSFNHMNHSVWLAFGNGLDYSTEDCSAKEFRFG